VKKTAFWDIALYSLEQVTGVLEVVTASIIRVIAYFYETTGCTVPEGYLHIPPREPKISHRQ
jgi:hypothetical protein